MDLNVDLFAIRDAALGRVKPLCVPRVLCYLLSTK